MVEVDFISSAKTISKSLTYDQKELYNYLNSWFSERHYDVIEFDYSERIVDEDKRIYAFRWRMEKRCENLIKQVIELNFEALADDERVEMQDGSIRVAQKGEVKIKMRPFIERDVEEDWKMVQRSPERRVLRELFDKIVQRSRLGQYENDLKNDFENVIKGMIKKNKKSKIFYSFGHSSGFIIINPQVIFSICSFYMKSLFEGRDYF